jgi:alanyl-tRNA synthetase
MNRPVLTGAQIRQGFIDFFVARGHTFVPSASLVPGGDATLLFTNAGMVQFKDVFLGTDERPYTRAVNSQKCMRVAGKHNDLDEVGRDDTHHTFFEMLGNWSFGDYYKPDAIAWAWELLTDVWGLDKSRLYATCFQDEKGQIERDDEAAAIWAQQPGIDPAHILFFGRKENFWEMAETGPCGPCSEIHYDRGPQFCSLGDVPGHVCGVNGDCARYLEIWNLVFIQYNRLNADQLEPLPARHVDTGMGFERIVSILQDVDSNYKTDLLSPLLDEIQALTGDSDAARQEHFTPYRVIADHARAAAFLIADGVVPGNTGRSYICRMIIRRAARFGGKIGLEQPFLARVAERVITQYGSFYPELEKARGAILDNLTREEVKFRRTLESGLAKLDGLLAQLRRRGETILPGDVAFELYGTYGLPLEISRDIAREGGLGVDEAGFQAAMAAHRTASGAGEVFGEMGGADAEFYRELRADLAAGGHLPAEGVRYDPYAALEVEGPLLALVQDGEAVLQAEVGDTVEVVLPETGFYIAAGGQVADTGLIYAAGEPDWEIEVEDMRKPAAGMVVHVGRVRRGTPHVGDLAVARVDQARRRDIQRNHTATHLLHAELHAVLGAHATQAGSLVAPDRLRFDFNHPQAVTPAELEQIEAGVNRLVLEDYALNIRLKSRQEAIDEGAMALFGEKYGETVRTIAIGADVALGEPVSYELCGGTHVEETGDIGLFLITAESGIQAGVRRIEAVTGRGAYELVKSRFAAMKSAAQLLGVTPAEVPAKIEATLTDVGEIHKQVAALRRQLARLEFERALADVARVGQTPVLALEVAGADADILRELTDRFRAVHPSGVALLATVTDGRPLLIAAVTEDLVARGLRAGDLVKFVAAPLGGGGGGKPTLAQAGGKDATALPQALASVTDFVRGKLEA